MTALVHALNALSVAALIALVVLVAGGVADLTRECWQPERVGDTPGFKVLPRPFDYERDG